MPPDSPATLSSRELDELEKRLAVLTSRFAPPTAAPMPPIERPTQPPAVAGRLDSKQEQRGIQRTHLGTVLIDNHLACPLIPQQAATATSGLNDKQIHEMPDDLARQLAAHEPFLLKLKQGPDASGTIRLQCPAAGPVRSITCPRFNRLHPPSRRTPAVIDLTNHRSTAAHPAAKPAAQTSPAERLRPPPEEELPRICRKATITIRPGDPGMLDKFRQDLPIQATGEYRGHQRLRQGHRLDTAEPKKRLVHGRAAQTILIALMLYTLNLQILHDWQHATGGQTSEPDQPPRGDADR